MKKGQIMEGTVERVDFPDKGILPCEEGNVTVKNTLPGQNIRYMITKKRSGRAEGRLLEVLQHSELENRSPVCDIFPACGGCSWQTLSYDNQLTLKASQVRRLLKPVLYTEKGASEEGFDGVFEGIRRSPKEFAYRNKMEFTFGDAYKDGPMTLGLHKRGSHYDVLTASRCQLVHSDLTVILDETLSFFRERQVPYYHKLTHEGILRHLLLRRAEKTGEILVCLVTSGEYGAVCGRDSASPDSEQTQKLNSEQITEQTQKLNSEQMTEQTQKLNSEQMTEQTSDLNLMPDADKRIAGILRDYTARLLLLHLEGRIVGILHMQNDSVADVVQSDRTTILYGQDFFYENLLGLRFKITPFSFFQTNSLGAEVLYSAAREFVLGSFDVSGADINPPVEKPAVIFDLYSGTGTIAQILAPIAGKVVGVEIIQEAVEAARENAAGNGLDNCTFLAGDVLKVLDTIPDRPDFIVLDPPRDGIHPKALQKIIAYGAPRILYISCKPTSLARDLEVLLANGYQVERICCVDMFPQTTSIETICLLHKPF